MKESSSSLPGGWCITRLENLIVRMSNGANAAQYSQRVGLPITRIETISTGKIDLSRVKFVKEDDEEFIQKYALADGDILFSHINSDAHLGKTALYAEGFGKLVHGINLLLIRPSHRLSSAFLHRQFQYLRQAGRFVAVAQRAVNQSSINQRQLNAFDMMIAPRREQDRIASKIDELFSEIEEGERALEKVQKLVERYRQSVLKAAVTGELTREWREKNKGKLESGEALLARILKARREAWEHSELEKMKAKGQKPTNNDWKAKYKEPTPPNTTNLPELPEGWVWASLGQLLINIEAGKSFRCDERPPSPGEYGIVKVSAVTWGVFDEQESKTITNRQRINGAYLIQRGDFLFSRANTLELVGACLIVDQVSKRLLLSDKILRFNFAVDVRTWVNTVLKSRLGRGQIEALSTGNQQSMRNIGQERIGRIAIPLPNETEICIIEDEISRRDELRDYLAHGQSDSSKRAQALRQSILKQAFIGELVPQNPTDEPAHVLLERIAIDRTRQKAEAALKTTHRKKVTA